MVVEAISAAMKAAVRRIFAARPCPLLAAGLLAAASLVALGTGPAGAAQTRFTIPASARQLVVVSSPTYDPADYLVRFQSFARASATSAWKPVFATWETEIGSGELRDVRREGDHATPTGVYGFGLATIYGTWPNPGGLHEPYHRFVCGDWWDEDPYSAQYNRFVHVACGTTPPFAAWSEPLWEETEGDRGYPYLAVIDYNDDPTIAGPRTRRVRGYSSTPGWTPRQRVASPFPSPSCWRCCAGSSRRIIPSSRSAPTPRSAVSRRPT